MPKLTIELNDKTHKILKELAKKDRRSLTNYIYITLEDYANANEKDVNITDLQSNQNNSNINSTTNPPQKKRSIIGLTMDTETEGADNLWN